MVTAATKRPTCYDVRDQFIRELDGIFTAPEGDPDDVLFAHVGEAVIFNSFYAPNHSNDLRLNPRLRSIEALMHVTRRAAAEVKRGLSMLEEENIISVTWTEDDIKEVSVVPIFNRAAEHSKPKWNPYKG